MQKTFSLFETIASKTDFTETYQRHWDAEKALKFLESNEIFPLDYVNEKLPILTELGLRSYLSGTLTMISGFSNASSTSKTMFSGSISREGAIEKPEHITNLESRLDMSFNSRSSEYLFKQNGATYARLLHVMGFNTTIRTKSALNNKAREGSSIPKYLKKLIDNYEILNEEEKPVANNIIHTFVNVVFGTKYSHCKDKWIIHLLEQPSESKVIEQGEYIIKATTLLYPDIKFGKINSGESTNHYRGSISLRKSEIIKLSDYGLNLRNYERLG